VTVASAGPRHIRLRSAQRCAADPGSTSQGNKWQYRSRASGALRGEVVNARLAVIASAAKQSILSLRGKMDCFAALAMTVYKLNRRGC